MIYKRRQGFTLVEMLITVVLVFLLFAVMYATFFSVSNTTQKIQQRMKSSEIMFRFVNKFSGEVKSMIREKNDETSFDLKEISFITTTGETAYPVKITYTVNKTTENAEKLLRKQENLISDYSFTFPVMDEYDSISFLFFSDGVWQEYADSPESIKAVGIEIIRGTEKYFFPAVIYGAVIDEKGK
ncbi:MAG: prepilin-type N-terminal cleavage/methylation domain-containing protein [Elusimicrobia bacterium]|mgnify:CR=1 FL=1|jgi:prepilin-type N-terminal cleavage/methylation domain-containing protein|nr:prepilin-type N-terminal cleavage/methylation domain-containing protein [Elusimicrobiota bacterium]